MFENGTSDRERYERARQRVELLRGFYSHALVFGIVNTGLAIYNLATTADRLWFVLTFVGWGIGLIAHGAYVFGSSRFLGADWQERKIRETLDREDRITR